MPAKPISTLVEPEAHVDIDDVSIGYWNRNGEFHAACIELDIEVAKGEFLVIVGPSGCGKTTLLEALAGLVPLADGEIRIAGHPIQGPGPERSLVFQSPSLLPWRSVRQNVTFPLQAQRSLTDETRDDVDRMIELVGLAHVADHSPQELSGGMKQRVNLARALVTHPSVLLLDEPFGALDAQTRAMMQEELLRVWRAVDVESQLTAVFVTHDVEEAVLLADRILVFSPGPGEIVLDLPVELPRPRLQSSKRSARFLAYQDLALEAIGAHDKRSDPRP